MLARIQLARLCKHSMDMVERGLGQRRPEEVDIAKNYSLFGLCFRHICGAKVHFSCDSDSIASSLLHKHPHQSDSAAPYMVSTRGCGGCTPEQLTLVLCGPLGGQI